MNQATEPDIEAIESEIIRLFKKLSPDRQQQMLNVLAAEIDSNMWEAYGHESIGQTRQRAWNPDPDLI